MRSGRFAVAVTLVVVAWVASTGVAHAHDDLVSSIPADGQSIPMSPAGVELEFAGELQSLGDQSPVVVTEADGTVVSDGEPGIDGPYVRQSLAPNLPDGEYQIAYRVVSSDGHLVSGTTRFFVGSVPAAVGQAGARDDSEDNGRPWTVLAVAGGVVVVTVALLVIRRGRREPRST